MLIDVRCNHCNHLLAKVSKDFYGLVEVYCRTCKHHRLISLAIILKQISDEPAILDSLTRVRARA